MKIVYAKLLDLNDINILKLFDILGTQTIPLQWLVNFISQTRSATARWRSASSFYWYRCWLQEKMALRPRVCTCNPILLPMTKLPSYLHGKEFFNLLNSPRTGKTLHFEQFARLGFIAGIPEEYVATRLKEFGSSTQDRLDYETFIMCYFDLLSQLDEFVKRRNSQALDDSGAEGKRCIICWSPSSLYIKKI